MRVDELTTKLDKAANLLHLSDETVILSGAGISTPSGIPDFRSAGSGVWNQVDPADIISLSIFKNKPEAFFTWLLPFAQKIQLAQPNAAHLAITRMQANHQLSSVITQNIDNLHTAAGSTNVIELHGNLQQWGCLSGHPISDQQSYLSDFCKDGHIPVCQTCSAYLKPGIVLFEEPLPMQAWENALDAVKSCRLMIVVGSSLVVGPANELPLLALQNKAKLIIITLSPTPMDVYADLIIHQPIEKVLPNIEQRL